MLSLSRLPDLDSLLYFFLIVNPNFCVVKLIICFALSGVKSGGWNGKCTDLPNHYLSLMKGLNIYE